MTIEQLIIEKAKFKLEVIDTMGIPAAKALAADAFMAEVITILTAQETAITAMATAIRKLTARVKALEDA